MQGWINENWFNLLSAAGIICSLLFTAISLRSETKTRRISNLLGLTQSHRDLWSQLFTHPDLGRIFDPAADTESKPITLSEQFFVTLAIQHIYGAYETLKTGLAIKPKGLCLDVRMFFSLPIPRRVWEKLRIFQNDDFAQFIEHCTSAKQERDC